ncbi:hypothetical protein H8356DRAFT_1640705 [Neocallimastix lanati (nom. inval.)]|nr:hypothetical protein H8356DRAFT_1640705 [Neocallimastix sp. JGI-2020a]
MKYMEPLVYSISSCNEKLRLPYIYNMPSYEQPDHKNIIVDPYYNNLNNDYGLVIMDMDSNTFEWGGDGRFAYLSNNYGLQLIGKGFLWPIYEMKINETGFSINESVIVNNTQDLKLEYDSEPNALTFIE